MLKLNFRLSIKNNFIQQHFLLLIFLSVFIYPITAQIEETDEEIKVDSSLVLLNATITDKEGNANLKLNKEEFEVFEDGIKQSIAFFSNHETPFAAVILIDTSGSMKQRISLARAATINFLSRLRDKDYVAIYNFDSKVSLVQDFSNLRDLIPQVYDLKASGWTVLNDAVYLAATKLEERKEKRKAIVVLSDGADTRSGRSASKSLKLALKSNITMYTVDISLTSNARNRMQNRRVLKNFASKSGGKFIKTSGGITMREAFKRIVKDLGVQYTIGYYPTNSEKDGKWRKINLKVSDKNSFIRTRKGYTAPKN